MERRIRQGETEGLLTFLVLDVLPLAEYLHANHALPVAAGKGEHLAYLVRRPIHVALERVEAGEEDIQPRRLGGSAERVDVVARDADGADAALGLGTFQCLHGRLVLRRPVAGSHAMHQEDIQVVRAKHLAEGVDTLEDIRLRELLGAGNLRLESQLLAR